MNFVIKQKPTYLYFNTSQTARFRSKHVVLFSRRMPDVGSMTLTIILTRDWFRREEYAIIWGYRWSELEILLIDSPDNVTTNVIQGIVIEDTKKLRQKVIRENSVFPGEDTCPLFKLALYQLHGIVDRLSQWGQFMYICYDSRFGDILWPIDQIGILCLLWKVKCALLGKIHRGDGHHDSISHGTVLNQFRLNLLISAIGIAQED